MKKLKFYNLSEKKSFETDDYEIVERNGRKFSVAISPSGTECWRILPKDFDGGE